MLMFEEFFTSHRFLLGSGGDFYRLMFECFFPSHRFMVGSGGGFYMLMFDWFTLVIF